MFFHNSSFYVELQLYTQYSLPFMVSAIRQRMAKDIDEVAKIAVGTKAKIEELDKDVSSRFLLFIQS